MTSVNNDMAEGSESPHRHTLALTEWRPILHASSQVVLYNATSHALSVRQSSPKATSVVRRNLTNDICPYCHRHLRTAGGESDVDANDNDYNDDLDEDISSRAPNYFQLLQVANETASIHSTPHESRTPSVASEPPDLNEPEVSSEQHDSSDTFRAGTMAEGYFKAFFQEECRLGMGANGTVYLCQHVLDGNPLGHFAVKKIAVGKSHTYLIQILREVRLLEKLHHPNIITYHHAWLETCQFSAFGPTVPTLHVLMQWAEGGSLDDFIDVRLGRPSPNYLAHFHTPGGSYASKSPEENSTTTNDTNSPSLHSRSARIRAFRAMQRAPPAERERMKKELEMSIAAGQNGARSGKTNWTAVHLLSAEEVKGLFSDVVSGLAFLHDKAILHLDLKPGNVLLTWDEGKLIPRAMLSDFGTSQDMLNQRTRSGNTGTLEYTSPESLPCPSTGACKEVDSKADIWSLGMILHKLLFLRLPYTFASDNVEHDSKRDGKEIADRLEQEVRAFTGFRTTPSVRSTFESRRMPQSFLILLERLLHIVPSSRPSAERVLFAIREGQLDPLSSTSGLREVQTSLIPRSPPPPMEDTEHERSSVSGYEDANEAGPAAFIKEEALPQQSNSTDTPAASRSGALWLGERQNNLRVPRVILTRTLKSVVLIAKVLSLYQVCGNNGSLLLKILVLGLAIIDTWFDSLQVTLLLGAVHMVILPFLC